jgi:hypothetical protein
MFGFFVNDNKNVDVKFPKTQTNNCLIIYNITNGITTLKNYVNVNHFIIAKMFQEEINSPLKGKVEREPTKER